MSILLVVLSIAALLQALKALGYKRRVGLVVFDQAFQTSLELGRHARAAMGFLARVALVGLADRHLAHLGIDEIVEQPAGARQDFAGAAEPLLAAGARGGVVFRCLGNEGP
jgi:hypothetical protein